jgi:DNA polymerase III subunit epsilon
VSFKTFDEARSFLFLNISKFELCPKLCGIQKPLKECFDYQEDRCKGACGQHESPEIYNARVKEWLAAMNYNDPEFYLTLSGRKEEEKALLFFEKEIFAGYVFCDREEDVEMAIRNKILVRPYEESKVILRRFLTVGFS